MNTLLRLVYSYTKGAKHLHSDLNDDNFNIKVSKGKYTLRNIL